MIVGHCGKNQPLESRQDTGCRQIQVTGHAVGSVLRIASELVHRAKMRRHQMPDGLGVGMPQRITSHGQHVHNGARHLAAVKQADHALSQ